MPRDEWLALYQQKPTKFGEETAYSEAWLKDKIIPIPEEQIGEMHLYMLCDPANKKHKKSNYTALWVVGLGEDRNFYFVDLVWDKLDQEERYNMAVEKHKRWHPISRVRNTYWEQYGLATDTEYIERRQKQDQYRFNITPMGGTEVQKEERIKGMIGVVKQGAVYFRAGIMGLHDGKMIDLTNKFIQDQLLRWPAVRTDDPIDLFGRVMDRNLSFSWPPPKNKKPSRLMVERERPMRSFMEW